MSHLASGPVCVQRTETGIDSKAIAACRRIANGYGSRTGSEAAA